MFKKGQITVDDLKDMGFEAIAEEDELGNEDERPDSDKEDN